MFRAAKAALAIAKHNIMGGIYHEFSKPGVSGIVVDVPFREYATGRRLTISELDHIYGEKKSLLLSSIPVPSQAVHGLGFYDSRPAMGIFAISDMSFKPFFTSPISTLMDCCRIRGGNDVGAD